VPLLRIYDRSGGGTAALDTPMPQASVFEANTSTAREFGAYSEVGVAAVTTTYRVTALNFFGESLPSAPISVAPGGGGNVTLNWDDVPGATGYNVYRDDRLRATVTDSTYFDNGGPATGPPPPTVNTTGSAQASEAEALARAITPANLDLLFGYGVGFIVGVSEIGEEAI
jgi:hypothetical protein